MSHETSILEIEDTSPQITSTEGLEHLAYKQPRKRGAPPIADGLAEAVVYLRVSTPKQLYTAADLDEDGNSIATQRVQTYEKVRNLKATVVREFVEPGQSAQTIDKRPEFKRLLRYIDEHPSISYVVIYMRSRVFRNFTDAAITKRQLLEKGVRLISAKEEFGDGYMGDAMEAITDIMNEVQVRQNGEDIKVKMAHKVAQGGSVGRAKLGYLNVRKEFSGRLVNTIDVDPVRAPLITWLFEQYATGHFSIAQLRELAEEQGLTTRPSATFTERPLSNSQLARVLRDPYYTGIIRYKGDLFGGRHEALISKELFLEVQTILDQRNRQGDRDRIHFHFLKGIMFCASCAEQGRRSRMIFTEVKGNGGDYEYFVCTAKQRALCDTNWIRADLIEDKVERAIAAEALSQERVAGLKTAIQESLDDLLANERAEKAQLRKQLTRLENQESRLIDLAADGTVAVPKLKQKLAEITLKKGAMLEKLEGTDSRLRDGAAKATAFIDLLENPVDIYRQSDERARRDLLRGLFAKIMVTIEDDAVNVKGVRSEANQAVHAVGAQIAVEARDVQHPDNEKVPRVSTGDFLVESGDSPFVSPGSSKTTLVAGTGFEPATSGL